MYDLTGADPEFLVENKRFTIFRENQIVEFDEPVFAGTITGVKVLPGGTDPFPSTNWNVREPQDWDVGAISLAKTMDETFAFVLAKSMVVTAPYTSEYQIELNYQRFHQTDYGAAAHATTGPEYTPELMQDVIDRLEYVQELYNPIIDMTSDLLSGILVLDRDLTGLNPDNIVEDELHYVNVPNNKRVIFPAAGSFYHHDVVIKKEIDDTELVQGAENDFIIISCNLGKTEVSDHSSGVYDIIYILSPVVGNLKVTYRAFGGDATAHDVNEIKQVLYAMMNWLETGHIITAETLATAPAFWDLTSRVVWCEDQIRALDASIPFIDFSIAPSAGDETKHWYNIATLFKRPETGIRIYTKDTFHYRISGRKTGITMDVVGSIDVNNPIDTFDAQVLNSANIGENCPIDGYGDLNRGIMPEFRVLWTENDGIVYCGITGDLYRDGHPTEDPYTIQNVVFTDGAWGDIAEGMRIGGIGIPNGTVIAAGGIDQGAGTITMDQPATMDQTGAAVVISNELYSGIQLQMGFALRGEVTEDFIIEDHSGNECDWALNDSAALVWDPEDGDGVPGGVDLPDGSSVWTPGNDGAPTMISKHVRRILGPDDGYIAWAGSIPLTQFADAWQTVHHFIATEDVRVDQIKQVDIHVFDRLTGLDVIGVNQHSPRGHNLPTWETVSEFNHIRGGATIYDVDMCAVGYDIEQQTDNSVDMQIRAYLGSESLVNERFDLRQIVFRF